jgi:hypothetical protein
MRKKNKISKHLGHGQYELDLALGFERIKIQSQFVLRSNCTAIHKKKKRTRNGLVEMLIGHPNKIISEIHHHRKKRVKR